MRRAIINSISLNDTPLGPSDNAASYNNSSIFHPHHVIESNLPSTSNRDHAFVDEFHSYPSHSTLPVVCANPHVLGTGFLMDPTAFHPMHIPHEATCMRNPGRRYVSGKHRLISSITSEFSLLPCQRSDDSTYSPEPDILLGFNVSNAVHIYICPCLLIREFQLRILRVYNTISSSLCTCGIKKDIF